MNESTPDRPTPDHLSRRLQTGDPAGDGSAPTADELTRMRRTILRVEPARRPMAWLPVAVAATLVVALGLLLLPRGVDERPQARVDGATASSPDLSSSDPASPHPASPAVRTTGAAHQIQFATENGTQVIWVLNPDLEL